MLVLVLVVPVQVLVLAMHVLLLLLLVLWLLLLVLWLLVLLVWLLMLQLWCSLRRRLWRPPICHVKGGGAAVTAPDGLLQCRRLVHWQRRQPSEGRQRPTCSHR